MALVDNKELFGELEKSIRMDDFLGFEHVVKEAYVKDFVIRACWSSNALEGNTLSLDETISAIDYDEVRSGHTFSEYQEAKNGYRAICKSLLPLSEKKITETWLLEANGFIMGKTGEYRKGDVYIGSAVEAVYFPPSPSRVIELMSVFFDNINFKEKTPETILEEIARQHIEFERIHPFQDGNGRVGRIIMNQQLINNNMLPIAITPTGKYRQAFRIYNKNGDVSMMVHLLAKEELEAVRRANELAAKFKNRNECMES